MSFSRRALGASIAVALAAPALVTAADPSLRVLRQVGNQDIPLRSVTYDIASKRLVATSVAGNFACNAPTAIPDGALHLQIDGTANRYPIKVDGVSPGVSMQYDPANVRFEFTLDGILGTGCASTGLTIYSLTFPGQPSRDVAAAFQYDLPTRTFDLRVRDPLLCTSYAAAASGVTIELTDANGVETVLPGLSTVGYAVDPTFDLRPTSSTVSRYDFAFPLVQCAAPGATAGSGGGPVEPSPVGFFRADFENPIRRGSVAVAVNVPGSADGVLSTLPGAAFGYTFTVANTGNGDARNVRIREYVPQASGSSPAVVIQGTSGWTCMTSGAVACPVGSGAQELPINLSGLTIPAGETWTFTISRALHLNTQVDAVADIGYAAFVDPTADGSAPNAGPDTNLQNNGAWFQVKAVANQLPVFTAIGAQTFAEDASAQSVAFSLSDSEGDTIGTPTASSSNATLFPNGSLVVVPGASANQYTLQMTPAADKNGTATITLTAAATSGTMTPVTRTFDVTVTAVNDPPVFTLASNAVQVPACASGTSCQYLSSNFVTAIAPGPASATDEASQTLEVVRDDFGQTSCSAAPSGFFGAAPGPQVMPNGANYNLAMPAIGSVSGTATCAITVREVDAPTSLLTMSFTITY